MQNYLRKWPGSLGFIFLGHGLSFLSGLLLLLVYGLCLTNPASPTYYTDKLPKMFDLRTGGGILAWPATGGFILGVLLIGYGIAQLFSPQRGDDDEQDPPHSFGACNDERAHMKPDGSHHQSGITSWEERFRRL
jgi:hypothetical protein